jgi:hypothetical protein
MDKNSKLLLGVAVVGVVGYLLLSKKLKPTTTAAAATTPAVPATTTTSFTGNAGRVQKLVGMSGVSPKENMVGLTNNLTVADSHWVRADGGSTIDMLMKPSSAPKDASAKFFSPQDSTWAGKK